MKISYALGVAIVLAALSLVLFPPRAVIPDPVAEIVPVPFTGTKTVRTIKVSASEMPQNLIPGAVPVLPSTLVRKDLELVE